MIGTTRSAVTIPIAAIVLAACASGGTGSAEAAGEVSAGAVAVQINNDLVPPAVLTLWIVPETGARRRLGTVNPNGQATFSFSPTVRAMEHRLVAEVTGGNGQTSNPFSFDAVSSILWNVSSPNVRVNRGGDSE
ncbi:MAG: hypothetical protein ACREL7_04670 [Longimicrobiales bacterium]